MGHTSPDWTTYGKLDQIFALYDLGELAVRLGSIVSFDRRGNVLWLDDFESGIANWWIQTEGAASAAIQSNEASRNKTYSLKLTAGSVVNNNVQAIKLFPFRVQGIHAIECSLALVKTAPIVTIYLDNYDGEKYRYGAVRYVPSADVLQVRTDLEVWSTVMTGLVPYESQYCFHTLKLIVDWVNEKYVRILLNSLDIDLAEYSIPSSDSTEVPIGRATIEAKSEAAELGIVYVDDVIYTINED